MRTFIALDLPEETREQLSDLQGLLRVGRHVPEENLHLTLSFLGEQPLPALEALHEVLCDLPPREVVLRLSGLDILGSRQPKLLFIRAERSGPLAALRREVLTAVRLAGIELPRTRFRPHVTLARFSRDMEERDAAHLGRFLQTHGDRALPEVVAEQVTLYQSVLREDGARYDPLASYPLVPMAGET
ncbi:2'-5' RNA ligase [Salinihabitans flavidus]|uniref:RNA 2',3'-cyclic phosphodiesterase n=1 Tax=Salinihabitans flavidus TaxID=569882 RepID=A0A1H8U880_9RHOB|nr:RNA 2',3'-cyclic phosphodiesterase [Salinihabitans flavidus]SEO99286.1 2'-5' RNA ligase [Salinihabitans flavidus]